jgi:hypothetical protein
MFAEIPGVSSTAEKQSKSTSVGRDLSIIHKEESECAYYHRLLVQRINLAVLALVTTFLIGGGLIIVAIHQGIEANKELAEHRIKEQSALTYLKDRDVELLKALSGIASELEMRKDDLPTLLNYILERSTDEMTLQRRLADRLTQQTAEAYKVMNIVTPEEQIVVQELLDRFELRMTQELNRALKEHRSWMVENEVVPPSTRKSRREG